ncbi:hypothetical protein B0H10DRAFT_1990142, partial [Mycena sp. CBHHK59/15]
TGLGTALVWGGSPAATQPGPGPVFRCTCASANTCTLGAWWACWASAAVWRRLTPPCPEHRHHARAWHAPGSWPHLPLSPLQRGYSASATDAVALGAPRARTPKKVPTHGHALRVH